MSHFTVEERKRYLIKKHIKDHLFEYILDFIGPMILTWMILRLCKAQEIGYGMLLSFVYSLGRVLYNIYYYKKEYVDVDVKE